ncbi:salicylic acid-binding protein 2-like [Momordica charantia]|uniref:(S)-hydroxynitrile lyase n=1 Tax=Momordica charantia TaxID=3673 RepID=A0A6J1D5N6_MOMCH|nr:salicylic acid-binding protein 2-like [Momordica charantia]
MPNLNLLLLLFLFLFLCSSVAKTRSDPAPRRHHFVLVHGACHGAWSWYKVAALLRSAGHRVTAVDMAGSGIDRREAERLRSFSEYVGPLRDAMAAVAAEEKVVLVGHSQGGLCISKAMESFPDKISVAVFVAAAMPGPSLNVSFLLQQMLRRVDFGPDSRYTYGNGPRNPPTTLTFGPLFSASKLYNNSPKEDLTLANTLMRPTHLFGTQQWSKDLNLTVERYGSVKRVFVVSGNDRIINKKFQWWVIKRNPPTAVVEVRGSDHMVMMSKPFHLFKKLHRIARDYA